MAIQIARALWGALLLVAPRRALMLLGTPSPAVERVTRVLGARHLVEVGILAARRRRRPPLWPVAVDLLHATTMIVVAARDRRVRRDALASAAVAALLAGGAQLERAGV